MQINEIVPANLGVAVPLLFLMRHSILQNEEVIPNLVNSLQANDWKERQQAVEQFVDLVQLNPDGLGPKFTKVWLVTRLLDVLNDSLWPTAR